MNSRHPATDLLPIRGFAGTRDERAKGRRGDGILGAPIWATQLKSAGRLLKAEAERADLFERLVEGFVGEVVA